MKSKNVRRLPWLLLAAIPLLPFLQQSTAVATSTAKEQASELLQSLEPFVGPSSSLPASLSVEGPIASASAALVRSDELRKAGDITHAEIADDLALEWAQIARDIVRTSVLRQDTGKIRTRIAAIQSSASALKAQVEEALSRRGKLQVIFEELERERVLRAQASASTSTQAGGQHGKGHTP